MKKFLSLLLVLMLVASVAYAVPASNQIVGGPDTLKRNFGANLTELPLTTDGTKLEIWEGLDSIIMDSYDVCIMYQELEKRTGVDMVFVYPPVGSETDNFNTRVATGNLPHLFVQARDRWGSKSIDEACEDWCFDFTDLYNEGYAPNYKYLRDTYEDIAFDTVLDSGRLGVWWQFDYVGSSPWSGCWVRQDLLDANGLELPVTVDDWTNVIKTLYENGGYKFLIQIGANGGGGGDLDTTHYFFSAYDTGYEFYQVDGTIKYGPLEDGYDDALAILAGWMANGWMDTDWATYDWNGHVAVVADPSKYSIIGLNYGEIAQATLTAKLTVPELKWTPINGPKLTADQELHLRQYDYLTRSQYDALTSRVADEGIEKLATQFKDYYYSQDGGDLLSYGVEGISYEWDENNVLHWIYDSDESAQYFPINMQDETMDFWTVYPLFKRHNGGYLRDSAAYIMQPEVWECIAEWSKVTPTYGLPMFSLTAEEANDYANYHTAIKTYLDESIAAVVNGKMDVSEWPTVQQKMQEMGIQECIDIYQAALDRYNARG